MITDLEQPCTFHISATADQSAYVKDVLMYDVRTYGAYHRLAVEQREQVFARVHDSGVQAVRLL